MGIVFVLSFFWFCLFVCLFAWVSGFFGLGLGLGVFLLGFFFVVSFCWSFFFFYLRTEKGPGKHFAGRREYMTVWTVPGCCTLLSSVHKRVTDL